MMEAVHLRSLLSAIRFQVLHSSLLSGVLCLKVKIFSHFRLINFRWYCYLTRKSCCGLCCSIFGSCLTAIKRKIFMKNRFISLLCKYTFFSSKNKALFGIFPDKSVTAGVNTFYLPVPGAIFNLHSPYLLFFS